MQRCLDKTLYLWYYIQCLVSFLMLAEFPTDPQQIIIAVLDNANYNKDISGHLK